MPHTKTNTKWTKDLNVGGKFTNLPEGHIRKKLHDTGFGHDFLDVIPKAQATKKTR